MKQRFFDVVMCLIGISVYLLGCATQKEDFVPPETVMEWPQDISEPEPQKYATDWAGTTWVLRDSPEKRLQEFPGYCGFHLAVDGRLLLINLDTAVGDTWSADGNMLRFELLHGVAEIPMEGLFFAFQPEGESGLGKMRLVPEEHMDSKGIVFEKVGPRIDIVENHWIPKTLAGGNAVQWPMNREIHLILLPDAYGGLGFIGFGGENRFRGPIVLGEGTFTAGPIAMTRKIGPSSNFENVFTRCVAETSRFVQVDYDMFFYNGTSPVAAFRAQLFN